MNKTIEEYKALIDKYTKRIMRLEYEKIKLEDRLNHIQEIRQKELKVIFKELIEKEV